MEEDNTFEKLVTDLNSEERKLLLNKIKGMKDLSDEPLRSEPNQQEAVNFQREYKRLNLLQKLFIMLQQLFTGKDPLKIVENLVIKRFMERTERQAPGIVSFSSKKLLDGFFKELTTLNNYLSRISDPFRKALESHRKEFFAFFVSLQLEYVQQSLNDELNPYQIYESSKLLEAAEVKDEMNKRLAEILTDISEADKTKLSHFAFSLHYLYKLCFFDFHNLLSRFNDPNWGGINQLSFQAALKDLSRLLDVLQSASYPPPADATEAVILFYLHGNLQDPDLDMDETIKTSVAQVESAFAAIRKFNKTVPLLNIIKCMTRNLNYTPKIIKGGDDWFVLFKSYWEEQVSELYKQFYGESKKTSFITNTKEFFKIDKLPFLLNYNPEKSNKGYAFKYPNSLAFINGFYERLFLKALQKSLNILLLQGGFYKQENRTEFTDAYNFLNSLNISLSSLDNSLDPESDLGLRLDKVQEEILNGNREQSHLDILLREVDKKAKNIIENFIKCTTSVELILNGVLYSKSGSKYDSISNIKRIGGKNNEDCLNAWKVALNLTHKANELIREIYALESKEA